MTGNRILEDVTVVDLSTYVTGGFCTLMLGNQGADVIKVERPGQGDPIRNSGPPFVDGESPYFWTVNYAKKSVEIDLSTDAGLEAFYDLLSEADVLVQNFRPGVVERLGVDYDSVRERNEDIIYCAISAFGQTGPWRERAGYDLLVQGLSGIMSVTGERDGPPLKVGLPMTDLITGMWGAFGIVLALHDRAKTGRGEYIDLGMLDATLPWLTKQAGKVFGGDQPSRMGTKDPVLAPYQTFRTEDSHINIAALTSKLWKNLCLGMDREDLLEDPRFETNADRVEHQAELETELEQTLTERTTDEWMTILADEVGVPAAPVQDVEGALSNEQVQSRAMVHTIEQPDGPDIPAIEHPLNFVHHESGFEAPPPGLGADTVDVFTSLGYSAGTIEGLIDEGVLGATDDRAGPARGAGDE